MSSVQYEVAVHTHHEPIDVKADLGIYSCVENAEQRDRDFWCAVRQGLLMQVDAIERRLGISPRTAEIRKQNKPERS